MAVHDNDRLRALANDRGLRDCPWCGSNTWDTDVVVRVPFIDVSTGANKDEGPEALPFACRNCGFIRLHSYTVLQRLQSFGQEGQG